LATTIGRSLTALLLAAVTVSASDHQPPASEQLNSLRDQLRAARAAKDWPASLMAADKLRALLNDAPLSLLEVARAEIHVGNLEAANRDLEQFVSMGQSAELVAKSDEFAPLRQQPSMARIQRAMDANRSPVSLASVVFELPDAEILAEDIDYDRAGKRFFITSVREKRIVTSDVNGALREFARAPDGWPILALKVDNAHGVVWATEVALRGFTNVPEAEWGRSALLCYELKSGKLLRRIEAPRPGALGDMTLTNRGEVIVSDGDGGGVYLLPAAGQALERLDGGDFISPQTPAMLPDGKRIFVPDYVRGIGVLDIATKSVAWLSTGDRFALNGIDGLYFDRGSLIAVQNGTSPERVISFQLDAALTKVQSETVIDRSTPTLGDPTHGVVIGNDFYYIASSGWENTGEKGELTAKPSPPRVMRVDLRKLH